MFRTIHSLALVAGLLGFAGEALAQDPVTERPGKVQSAPVPAARNQDPVTERPGKAPVADRRDPATERPGKAPAAPAQVAQQQAPAHGITAGDDVAPRNVLGGRTFAGRETLATYGAISFRFVNATTVEMIDRDGVTRGVYRQNGPQVSMTFGVNTYTGEFRNGGIAGAASNPHSNWTFQVSASK